MGSWQACFQSLYDNEINLTALVSNRVFGQKGSKKQKNKAEHVKEIVVDFEFMKNFEKCLVILKPIDMFITLFQDDAALVSDVYQAFLKL